jgi:hypothetical protein
MIDKISINLHAGSRPDIVKQQQQDQGYLFQYMKEIDWNLRIERYPKAYPSFSQLMNHAIATSKHEWMIFVNDRTTTSAANTLKICKLLSEGYACVYLYNVGYMGFSKELVRTIGWWDERYKLGGWEDRDWTFRLAQADLALYESQEVPYDYSWKSPLQVIGHGCRESQPHWDRKWEQKYQDAIVKMLPEENYEHWNLFLGDSKPEIRESWKKWSESSLNIGYDRPNSGPSASSMIKGRKIVNVDEVKHLIK